MEEKPVKRGVQQGKRYPMSVTRAVFHSEMSPLNHVASQNMDLRERADGGIGGKKGGR